jgi:hypothetical protein
VVRRAVLGRRSGVLSAPISRGPSVASVLAGLLTAVYVAVVVLVGLDTLLTAFDANESHGLVRAVDAAATPLTAPFRGIFDDQTYWATALLAAVVYTIGYLVAMAVLRRDRTI